MPGRSFTRPPRIMTIECSWRLWPTPGMYEVTSRPLVSRTRATLRSAEFGFFGVVVYTRMQTPRFCGHACIAGVFDFLRTASRPLRTSWLMVGMALHRRQRRQNSHFITEGRGLVKLLSIKEFQRSPPDAHRRRLVVHRSARTAHYPATATPSSPVSWTGGS